MRSEDGYTGNPAKIARECIDDMEKSLDFYKRRADGFERRYADGVRATPDDVMRQALTDYGIDCSGHAKASEALTSMLTTLRASHDATISMLEKMAALMNRLLNPTGTPEQQSATRVDCYAAMSEVRHVIVINKASKADDDDA